MKTYIAVTALLFLFTCGSTYGQDLSETSVKTILTAHDWGYRMKVVNKMQEAPKSCEADNIFRFNKDGTFEFLDGAVKCDASAASDIILIGKWSYDETLRKILLESEGEKVGYWEIGRLIPEAMYAHISYILDEENKPVSFFLKKL